MQARSLRRVVHELTPKYAWVRKVGPYSRIHLKSRSPVSCWWKSSYSFPVPVRNQRLLCYLSKEALTE